MRRKPHSNLLAVLIGRDIDSGNLPTLAALIGRIMIAGILPWDGRLIVRSHEARVTHAESFGVPGFPLPGTAALKPADQTLTGGAASFSRSSEPSGSWWSVASKARKRL